MIKIIENRELIYETEDYDVILVGTSVYCMLTAGFQSKMRFKYPIIEQENDKTKYADRHKLGTRLTIEETTPIISLLYICGYPTKKYVTIEYDALEKCLLAANAEFKGKKVATTLLGATTFDGNGEREKCLEIIERCTPDLDLTIYDYEQYARRYEEKALIYRYIKTGTRVSKEEHQKNIDKYNEMRKKSYLCEQTDTEEVNG